MRRIRFRSFHLKRKSKDCHVYNGFGLSLIDLCCEYDVHILNGRLFDDIDGNFTCISNDGLNIVDYILASTNLFELFSSFSVNEYDVSDHFITVVKEIEHWFYQGEHIEIVPFYKYLGQYFTQNSFRQKQRKF